MVLCSITPRKLTSYVRGWSVLGGKGREWQRLWCHSAGRRVGGGGRKSDPHKLHGGEIWTKTWWRWGNWHHTGIWARVFWLKTSKCISPRKEPARWAGDQAMSSLWLEQKEGEIVRGWDWMDSDGAGSFQAIMKTGVLLWVKCKDWKFLKEKRCDLTSEGFLWLPSWV